ncbi:MAG TPA: IclR family transcriptional regulator [Hyphomonas sp.]|nr:IclR family transcriptional regulator [Hyphomonas sp.]MAN65675.1 IclR family transcriptional regulator [Hyphomonadaceae bacterium]HBL92365.1 IclR family transcriptional regulator [Hyphomonas sp.]HCJ17947.1 IclR family transcriptional regulator [Hyphomonas sp.]HCN93734.1 IclR family transcriptional regulator [Hyphomonas sp.]
MIEARSIRSTRRKRMLMTSQRPIGADVSVTADLPRPPELADLEESYGEDRKFIWSVARTLQLLQAFRPEEGPMGNGDLSERTGIAKATVSRITHTLTELGYLARTRNRQYFPTSNLLSLSHSVLGSFRIRQLAQRKMQEIANLAGGTVGLSWPDKDTMIYIAASIATTSDDLMPEIGTRMSMAKSAAGRAYLSTLDEEELQLLFDRWAIFYGAEWPELEDRVHAAIADVKQKGFCIVEGEWRKNVRGVAAPVFDRDHDTWLALNCGGPAFDLDRERIEADIGPRMVHFAQSLSSRP